MFLGHYAIAFAAKRVAPKTSLGTLFAASIFIDLEWPVFLLLGIEQVRIAPGDTAFTPLAFETYPFSHSLLACVAWAILFGGLYAWRSSDKRAAIVVAALVISHWVLDAISHRPDLPLTPFDSIRIGMGLWNSVPMTLIVELLLFVVGISIYQRMTGARDAKGSWGLVLLSICMLVIYLAAAFGSVPPNVDAIAWSGNAQWLFVLLGAWVDRHRTLKP